MGKQISFEFEFEEEHFGAGTLYEWEARKHLGRLFLNFTSDTVAWEVDRKQRFNFSMSEFEALRRAVLCLEDADEKLLVEIRRLQAEGLQRAKEASNG